jgi:YD repeat-containing protein
MTRGGRITADTVHNPLGDGVHRVTTYGWNDAVDRPAWVSAPGAETVHMGYDSITRNPRWQQQGGSEARRVWFEYNANGQVARIRYPHHATGAAGGGGRDSLVYDAVGNLKRTYSPLGFVTLMYRDALGRVTETISPVHAGSSSDSASVVNTGLRQTVAYDIMDRDTLSVTYGRPMSFSPVSGVARLHATNAEAVTVRTKYDDAGLPLEVQRWATPDTAHVDVLTTTYGYDRAGLKTGESDGMVSETYTYDPAGNVLVHRTRRSHEITMRYDALGRMTRRVTPSVSYPANSVNCGDLHWTDCVFRFPTYPNDDTGGWTIPADTAYFAFDAAGNMVRAQNGDAVVSRTYYPGGALKTDTLALRAYGAGDFSKHVYGVAYRYDSAGRMRALLHLSNLAGAAQRDSFAYNAVTGGLETVVGRTNLSFGYGYDMLGRLTSESMPGTVGNAYTYDLDGRRLMRSGINGEMFTYDARGKVLSAAIAGRSTFYNSGLGHLVATEWDNDNNAAEEVEEFRLDALGHQVWRRSANAPTTTNCTVIRST